MLRKRKANVVASKVFYRYNEITKIKGGFRYEIVRQVSKTQKTKWLVAGEPG
jgi:3-methyladenine DNA glycosylase AlkC